MFWFAVSSFKDGNSFTILTPLVWRPFKASFRSCVVDMAGKSKSSVRPRQMSLSLCSLSGRLLSVLAQAPTNAELAVSVAAERPKPPCLMANVSCYCCLAVSFLPTMFSNVVLISLSC